MYKNTIYYNNLDYLNEVYFNKFYNAEEIIPLTCNNKTYVYIFKQSLIIIFFNRNIILFK